MSLFIEKNICNSKIDECSNASNRCNYWCRIIYTKMLRNKRCFSFNIKADYKKYNKYKQPNISISKIYLFFWCISMRTCIR